MDVSRPHVASLMTKQAEELEVILTYGTLRSQLLGEQASRESASLMPP